ncbi:tetratricopeptide repeat protein 21B-like [Styela clava]
MADDDVETLTVLNYYMSESYYRKVHMEAVDATRKFGSDPVLVLFKGLALLMEGRVQESMRELEVIKDKPDVSLASMIALIMAHKKSRTPDRDAVNELDARVKEERRSATDKSLYFAGLSLWHLGRSDKAREYVDKQLKNFNTASGQILRGWIDLTSDRDAYVKKSVKYFDEGLSSNNKDPWALIGKSRYNVKRKNFSAALELVNQAIVSYPNFSPALVERMRLHLALQDWDQTLEAANRLLNIDSRHPEALKTQIIYTMAREGKSSDVVTMLGELIQVIDRFEPQNTKLYVNSGKLFARMCGRNLPILNQTYTLLERAISVDATSAEFTCELGYQLFLQGKIRDAIKCYKNAMELDETSVVALTGVIRCQLFSDDVSSTQQRKEVLAEVSQQLEFLREVQQAIGQDPELLYLNAVHSRKNNKPQEESYQFLKDAMKAHFKSLKGLPLGEEYFMTLNPDFILDLARELLTMGPSEAIPQGQAVPKVLHDCVAVLDPVIKVLPGLLDALYLFAKAKFFAGEADAALTTLQHCIEQDSSYSDAHLLMAQIHQDKGNYAIASQYLESALSYNFEIRDHPLYHLIKAQTLVKSGEVVEAIQTLKMALAIPGVKKPPSASQKQVKKSVISATDRLSIFLELVHAHTKNNEHHEAIKVMQDAINAFQGTSEEIRVTIANADLSLSRGDVEQALTMLRNIKPDQSYYAQAKEKMAHIYLHHRRDKNLYISCYRDLLSKRPSSHASLLLGDAYMSIQEPDKAIEVYEQAMQQNPDSGLASKIGQALVKTHDYRRAIAYYEAALNTGQQQHLRFELAELLLQLKMYDKMEAILKQIPSDDRSRGETELERAMFDTKCFLLLSSLYKERNQHEKVAEELSKARDKQARVLKRVQLEQPESASSQKQLASDICCRMAAHEYERNKNTEQAIKYYKEALIYCENDSKAMIQLAKLYLQSSDLDICQQYCMQILKQTDTSGHSEASMMMADIMFRKNSYDEAIYHYQKLLEAKPDYYEALSRLIGLLRRSGKLTEAPQFLGLEEGEDTNSKKDTSTEGTKMNKKASTSNDPGYHYCKGLYEWYSGKTKEALRSFNIARRDSDWGEQAVTNMVRICLNPDQDTLGGEVLENLDDSNSHDKLTAAEAGISTAERLIKELCKTPAATPTDATKRKILEKYVLLGHRQKSSAEKALAAFMEILQNEKDNVSCLLGMAIAYQIMKQTPRARNQLKRISKMQWTLEDADNFEQAWLLLADVYISAGKFDMATELLKKCVEHNKSCCKAFEYLGYIYEKEQSYQDASTHYEKAWDYGNQANPSIGYKLSFNYLKARRFIDAINICHKVLDKNPQYPKIRKEILDKARSALRM